MYLSLNWGRVQPYRYNTAALQDFALARISAGVSLNYTRPVPGAARILWPIKACSSTSTGH